MPDLQPATGKRWPTWIVVLQAISVLCALPGGTLMLVRGATGPGLLLLVAGILFLVALVGGLVCSRR